MRKDVQKANNSVPQSAVSQRLLVTSTGTLMDTQTSGFSTQLYLSIVQLSYLDVLSQAVEDLLSHVHCFGEISFTRLINNVFS